MTFWEQLQVRRDQPHRDERDHKTGQSHDARVANDVSKAQSGDRENRNREEGLYQIGGGVPIRVREQHGNGRDAELLPCGQ